MTNFLSKYSNSDVFDMRSNGGLISTFDSFGNLLISSNETNISSSVITVELYSPRFSTDGINKIINTHFTEFISSEQLSLTNESSNELYNKKVEENKILQSKLDELTIKLNDPEKTSNELQIKDTIIDLRISLGQGSTTEDFSGEFPYINLN